MRTAAFVFMAILSSTCNLLRWPHNCSQARVFYFIICDPVSSEAVCGRAVLADGGGAPAALLHPVRGHRGRADHEGPLHPGEYTQANIGAEKIWQCLQGNIYVQFIMLHDSCTLISDLQRKYSERCDS